MIADFADGDPDARIELILIGTMEWLLRHGWIFMTSPKVIGPYFYGVQLTEKALKALGLLPVAVQEKQSTGTQRIEAAMDGKWTAVPKLLLAMYQAAGAA